MDSVSDVFFEEPRIVMTVMLIQLNKKIDLHKLARSSLNANYNKNRFPGCFVRCQKGSGSIFSSGKIIVSFSCRKLKKELEIFYINTVRKIDKTLEIVSSNIQTTTACASVSSRVFLNKLHYSLNKDIKFEAELFPALNRTVNVLGNDKVKIIVFGSGKFNITGCKRQEEIDEAYKIAKAWILPYIKSNSVKRKRQ